MKKNMIVLIALFAGIVHTNSVYTIDVTKLASAGMGFAGSAVPDVIALGGDIAKFIPVAKGIDKTLKEKIAARKLMTDTKAKEINLMEINIDVINLTVLLTGITAKSLRIVNKATPLLDSLVDPDKDSKATKAIGQFKEVFSTITSIMQQINSVNDAMYNKLVSDLKVLKPEEAKKAEETKVAKPPAEELAI